MTDDDPCSQEGCTTWKGQAPQTIGLSTQARGRGVALRPRLRDDDGAAVAEFPLVSVLIILIALAVIQAALILHTRNTLIDAAVQGAHHAALVGSTPDAGATRAEALIVDRFGESLGAEAVADVDEDGTVRVRIEATLPLVGLLGPAAGLQVEGRAIDEATW